MVRERELLVSIFILSTDVLGQGNSVLCTSVALVLKRGSHQFCKVPGGSWMRSATYQLVDGHEFEFSWVGSRGGWLAGRSPRSTRCWKQK